MKKHILNIIFALCITYAATAQNTGFGGKRVLFKTNLVNGTYGFCNTYQAEIAFHRQMTLSIGYDMINASVSQSYHAGETAAATEISMSEKANTSYHGYNIEYRKYFFNNLPAPYGAFVRLAFGNGVLDIENGSYSEALFVKENQATIKYSIKGITVTNYSTGIGYQKALNKWLFIGGHVSFNYFSFGDVINGIPDRASSGVLKNYGSNLLAFTFAEKKETHGDYDNRPIEEPSKNSYGFSGAIQIGFMIF